MTRKRTSLLLAVIVLIFGIFFKQVNTNILPVQNYLYPSAFPAIIDENSADFYPVVKVVDGDTFEVQIGNKKEKVRLIGVDTYEVVDPRKPVQCFGREASDFAKKILNDKKVRLEKDPTQGDRDIYKRLLRFAYLEDGTLFNKLLISEGYAHEYTYHSNPYKYQEEFIQAERDAREQSKGLWAEKACP